MAASAGIAVNPIKCGLYSPKGVSGSTRRFQLRTNQNASRARRGVITAQVDHKSLPYPLDALEPHMSSDTLECHWGKHHRAYVDNLNHKIAGTRLDSKTLDEIILDAHSKENSLPVLTPALQVWNHEFFWESMKPGGGGKPSGKLLDLINRDFGSFEKFVTEFKDFAADLYGSGWSWLVYKDNKLSLLNTVNAGNPLVWGYSPLLTIDLWEHAYYLDFQDEKLDYINTFIEELVSWDAVSSRLEAAQARVGAKKVFA